MKIILFNKKIFLSISLILAIFIILYFYIFTKASFAIKISNNEILNSKINEITTSDEKIAYLTFDDGPTTKATSKILDILKEQNVYATFFVVGKHVKENPSLVKRAYDDGHYIANHSYSHSNSKLYKSEQSFIDEVKNTDIEIGKAIGVSNYCAHIFRFPNGYMSSNYKGKKQKCLKLLESMDYTYVDWNCLNKDSEKKYTNQQLLNNLKKSSKDKGSLIILMHDTNDVNNTTDILNDSILYLKSEGYTFKNFYDLL